MRKNTILYNLWFAIIAVAFMGCVKDRGNYQMQEIPEFVTTGFTVMVNNEPAIIGTKNEILINAAGDHIKIAIDEEVSNGFDPDYHWFIYDIDPLLKPGSLPDPAIEIASTKDFDQKFNKGPGKYKLYRKVINKANGDAYFDEFTVEVESIKGLLVYYKNEQGNGDYGVVRTMEMGLNLPEGKMGVTQNVYSSVNGEHTIEKPSYLWLRVVDDANYPNEIMAASENGLTFINYRTSTFETSNYPSFFAFPLESAPAPQGHMNGSNKVEYLVQQGELYFINYLMASEAPKFVQLSDPGISYSPYMMTIPISMQPFRMYSNVVFNQTYQRFEYEDNGYLMPFMSVPGPLGSLDVDVSATQMDLLYMEKGKDNTINAVMKNGLGQLRYLVFDITDPYAVTCMKNIDLSALNTVTENGLWAVAERGPIAFFTKDNIIYALNYETGVVNTLLNEVPPGAQITVLKVLKDRENPGYDNAVLFITYNQGGQGTLLQYEFNPISGQLNNASKKVFSGFGKIVDIALKK